MHTEPIANSLETDWARVLSDVSAGNPEARERLVQVVYQELHRRAANLMRKDRAGVTLQATALLNEALLDIFGRHSLKANDLRHFLNIAAQQMRTILIDRARGKDAEKRKAFHVAIEDAGDVGLERSKELVALDDAMNVLAGHAPLAAQVVELKYFGGYTDDETAEILEINRARVRREWAYARAWLHDFLATQ